MSHLLWFWDLSYKEILQHNSWNCLRHCLEHDCTPFPWVLNPSDRSWYESDCTRDDVDIVDIQAGPWVYVSFRGSGADAFPHFSTIADILQDTSLDHHGLAISGIVCSNVQEAKNRHYWLLEVENRKTIGLYDSLHGFCPVRVETSRKLEVTGILLVKSQSNNPVLKGKELELKAGKPVHKERQSVPIAVKSRLAWLRSTQQNLAGSSNKVKKATGKRTVTDQASLGKFFDKAKNQSKTKTKVKAKVSCPTKIHDATNVCAVAEYGGNSEK